MDRWLATQAHVGNFFDLSNAPILVLNYTMIDLFTSYMRERFTLDKINAAVDEMTTFATANARLLTAPKQKARTNLFDVVDWMSFWISSFTLAKFNFYMSTMTTKC